MQNDINRIVEWCVTWSMELISEKCKVIHLGKQSQTMDYLISDNNSAQPISKGI